MPSLRHVGERVMEELEWILALTDVHLDHLARSIVLDDHGSPAAAPAPEQHDVRTPCLAGDELLWVRIECQAMGAHVSAYSLSSPLRRNGQLASQVCDV